MGSFVGFLGLLIASSRWYPKRFPYAYLQFVTIVAGLAALFVGSLWQIGELQKIGGTFFVLYVLEKLCEIPIEKRKNYAYLGLVVSGLFFGFCMMVRSHPETFQPYLLF